jgi:hypothetical protein
MILVSERPKTHALDRTATGICDDAMLMLLKQRKLIFFDRVFLLQSLLNQ